MKGTRQNNYRTNYRGLKPLYASKGKIALSTRTNIIASGVYAGYNFTVWQGELSPVVFVQLPNDIRVRYYSFNGHNISTSVSAPKWMRPKEDHRVVYWTVGEDYKTAPQIVDGIKQFIKYNLAEVEK